MTSKSLVVSRPSGSSSSDGEREGPGLWLRVSAFLSLRSPNTQITYRGIITEWCAFLGAEAGTIKGAELMIAATDLHAIAYRSWLDGRPGELPRATRQTDAAERALATGRVRSEKKSGLEATLSNATIYKKFSVLRRVYRMLIGADLGVRLNPFDADRVPPPAKESGRKRPTEMIDFPLVSRIVQQPESDKPKGLRDRAILSVMFGGALRRSEVAALRVGDVRRSQAGTLFLYLRSTKAKRDAQQALPSWAAEVVLAVLKQRVEEGAQAADYLFVSYTGKGGLVPTRDGVSASGVYKLFKLYCGRAGAGPFVTPHSARATAITKLLADGIPHRQVQEFSRHSSIQMVEAYDKRRIGVDENPGRELSFDGLEGNKQKR